MKFRRLLSRSLSHTTELDEPQAPVAPMPMMSPPAAESIKQLQGGHTQVVGAPWQQGGGVQNAAVLDDGTMAEMSRRVTKLVNGCGGVPWESVPVDQRVRMLEAAFADMHPTVVALPAHDPAVSPLPPSVRLSTSASGESASQEEAFPAGPPGACGGRGEDAGDGAGDDDVPVAEVVGRLLSSSSLDGVQAAAQAAEAAGYPPDDTVHLVRQAGRFRRAWWRFKSRWNRGEPWTVAIVVISVGLLMAGAVVASVFAGPLGIAVAYAAGAAIVVALA